jgi:hypothetical protein
MDYISHLYLPDSKKVLAPNKGKDSIVSWAIV